MGAVFYMNRIDALEKAAKEILDGWSSLRKIDSLTVIVAPNYLIRDC